MNLVEIAKLPQSKLVEWLKVLRADASREHQKLCEAHRANITTLRMESFHEGRLHAIDQVLAQLHPGHLQHPETQWKGEYDKNDKCDHWAVWACSKCKGFAQPHCTGACNCHWLSELQGIPIDVYDDSGGAAPIFDARHPSLIWGVQGEHYIWQEVESTRAREYLTRIPATQADLLEGLDVYRRCFKREPASILISYRGARCGIMICGDQKPARVDEPTVEGISELLRWRYRNNTHFTAQELADSLSTEGFAYSDIPNRWWPAVKAFRKLRQDVRLRKAQRFLEENL